MAMGKVVKILNIISAMCVILERNQIFWYTLLGLIILEAANAVRTKLFFIGSLKQNIKDWVLGPISLIVLLTLCLILVSILK